MTEQDLRSKRKIATEEDLVKARKALDTEPVTPEALRKVGEAFSEYTDARTGEARETGGAFSFVTMVQNLLSRLKT
jgi:hypothetical protein